MSEKQNPFDALESPMPASIFTWRLATLIILSFFVLHCQGSDDTAQVQAAFDKAEQLTAADPTLHVRIFFPSGKYFIRSHSGLVVPSRVTLAGDPRGESILLTSEKEGNIFGLRTDPPDEKFTYLPLARADDTEHPPLPEGSYRGVNYVYLKKDSASLDRLRSLGVPSRYTESYPGLKVVIASGATLSNNSRRSRAGAESSPAVQLREDSQINPTPAHFNTILAIDADGKVTLRDANRLNWGIDGHLQGESLQDYDHPSLKTMHSGPITGPAWIVPANNFHHDIIFEHLFFETDTSDPTRLRSDGSLLLSSCYDCTVRHCTFRNTPGAYHILAVRAFNTLIEDNVFHVYGEQSVTLDAGSGFTVARNRFEGRSWPGAAKLRIHDSAVNFIAFDEAPVDITILDNIFFRLKHQSSIPKKSGKAIFGLGGSNLRLIHNRFEEISRSMIETMWFNHHAIFAYNRMVRCEGVFGGNAAGLCLFENIYENPEMVRSKSKAIALVNPPGSSTNYFYKNRGISFELWHQPTTSFGGNTGPDNKVISRVNLKYPTDKFTGSTEIVASGEPSPLTIKSIQVTPSPLRLGDRARVTVWLSGVTDRPYPFFLIAGRGDLNAISLKNLWMEVPAGKESVTLENEIAALRPGKVTIRAHPLAAASSEAAITQVTVEGPKRRETTINVR